MTEAKSHPDGHQGTPSCATCAFAQFDRSHGDCRKLPPKTQSETCRLAWWPVVNAYDWCGEYFPRPKA